MALNGGEDLNYFSRLAAVMNKVKYNPVPGNGIGEITAEKIGKVILL